jgi:glycerophosphoryl diester phosphodiesterase
MPLISHRGAAGLQEANTLDAIRMGDLYKADYVEIDINCTSDNVLVLHHGKVSRFLRGKKLTQSFKELKNTYPKLITFKEFTTLCPDRPYMFDIKVTNTALLSTISDSLSKFSGHGMGFTSPHVSVLQYMQHAFPSALIMQNQPYHHGPITALEIARKNKFDGIALNKWWMTPLVYRMCKIHGRKLMCYTIDSKLGIKIVSTLFPDVYIVTNRPDRYRQLRPKD